MNRLINPLMCFMSIQIIPLLAWLIVPSQLFDISLQYYDKSHLGFTSLFVYATLLLSFYCGYKVSYVISLNAVHQQKQKVNLTPIILLHNTSLLLCSISVMFVIKFCFDADINVLDTVMSGTSNSFKYIVYSTSPFEQVLIMGRHLLATSAITWFMLRLFSIRKNTFPIILLLAIVLFVFTSSRRSLMIIIIIGALFHVHKPYISKVGLFKIMMAVPVLLVIFAIGVLIRSKGTWALYAGSSNVVIMVVSEFIGYIISPVNYSVALVEEGRFFYSSSVLSTFFSFILSVFNLAGEADKVYLASIDNFYNPSLNQIGLVGQWYTGFGPLLFIPSFVFGFISRKSYDLFIHRNITGMLFYPLVYFSLFDSFRGFLLTQNVIMSNILFIVFVVICYNWYTKAFRNDKAYN